MWHLCLVLVSCRCVSGVICAAVSVVEGDSVSIDCGFQTTVNGGNLLWQVLSNDSEISLGHIVPGDHFCGTDTLNCTVHTNGSITLIDVTIDDGDKRYRCLRGDREGYHYFSNVDLTVVSKESLGHPVIHPLTESKANVYMIEEKSVIHSYEQPTCEDKEDGPLTVTCFPPSGVIVDKVYDQVDCICTDSDENSNSLDITVNSHTELKKNSVAVIIILCVIIVVLVCIEIWCIYQLHKARKSKNPENIDVCSLKSLGKGTTAGHNRPLCQHDEEEGIQLNLDTDDVSQRLNDKEAECRDKSDKIDKLKEENQNKDTEISDPRQKLTEKETECKGGSKHHEGRQLNEYTNDVSQRLNDKKAECRDKSDKIDKLKEENQNKDMIILHLVHKLTDIDDSVYLHSKMSHLDIPWSGISAYSHHRDRYFCKVGASRNCKESDLDELLSNLSKHFRALLLCNAYEDHHMKVGGNPESSDKITFKPGEVELSHPSV